MKLIKSQIIQLLKETLDGHQSSQRVATLGYSHSRTLDFGAAIFNLVVFVQTIGSYSRWALT